jgi:hypothetical protein
LVDEPEMLPEKVPAELSPSASGVPPMSIPPSCKITTAIIPAKTTVTPIWNIRGESMGIV